MCIPKIYIFQATFAVCFGKSCELAFVLRFLKKTCTGKEKTQELNI